MSVNGGGIRRPVVSAPDGLHERPDGGGGEIRRHLQERMRRLDVHAAQMADTVRNCPCRPGRHQSVPRRVRPTVDAEDFAQQSGMRHVDVVVPVWAQPNLSNAGRQRFLIEPAIDRVGLQQGSADIKEYGVHFLVNP